MHRELDVVEGPGCADLDVDRLLPVGHLAQFLDLDGQVIRAGPVGVAAGRTLVHTFRQRTHLGHARVHLLAQQHAAAARLGALADHHLDGVGLAQVVRVEAVTRGQALIHQRLGRAALLLRHAAVTGGRAGAHLGRSTAQRFLHVRRQRTKAHAGDGDGDVEFDRLLGESGAEDGLGHTLLAVTLERVTRHRSGKEQQIIEMRHVALGTQPADLVETMSRSILDVVDDAPVEAGRFLGRAALDVNGLHVHLVVLLAATRLSIPDWRRRSSGTGCAPKRYV